MGRVGEKCGDAPVEVAFEVEPGGREPTWAVEGFEFGVVEGNVWVFVVGEWADMGMRSVMLLILLHQEL